MVPFEVDPLKAEAYIDRENDTQPYIQCQYSNGQVLCKTFLDADAIRLVLDNSPTQKAAELDPRRFFDNTLIREVNRDYASRLFPGQVKQINEATSRAGF